MYVPFKWPKKLKRGRTQTYKCVGGPLHGQKLDLSTPSTLVFTLGKSRGRYVASLTRPESEIDWTEVPENE